MEVNNHEISIINIHVHPNHPVLLQETRRLACQRSVENCLGLRQPAGGTMRRRWYGWCEVMDGEATIQLRNKHRHK